MSRRARAWLTPDEIPASLTCWQVFVPGSIEFEAAFRGALLLLQMAENWEQYGDQTPEDCAAAWFDANAQTFGMAECQQGVLMQVGTIFFSVESSPPAHCLPCYGQPILVADYPELFAIIGYQFGGSGTTFYLPDMKRRMLRTVDPNPPALPYGGLATAQIGSGVAAIIHFPCFIVAESP